MTLFAWICITSKLISSSGALFYQNLIFNFGHKAFLFINLMTFIEHRCYTTPMLESSILMIWFILLQNSRGNQAFLGELWELFTRLLHSSWPKRRGTLYFARTSPCQMYACKVPWGFKRSCYGHGHKSNPKRLWWHLQCALSTARGGIHLGKEKWFSPS